AALPADLDILRDADGRRRRVVLNRRIRGKSGGDLAGPARLDRLELRGQRRVALLRERERALERQRSGRCRLGGGQPAGKQEHPRRHTEGPAPVAARGIDLWIQESISLTANAPSG